MTKPVIGLVGGMGSGKSLVAQLFAKQGGRVISADQLGHEALAQADVRQQLVTRWGRQVLDAAGEIDRRRVGGIVFTDPQERFFLEALVFPWIERRIREELIRAEGDDHVRFVVLDAAIMLETGWSRVCRWIVYVDAPWPERLRRLVQRGWTEQDIAARESAQLPLTEKLQRADVTLDNSSSPEAAAQQVAHLLAKWCLNRPRREPPPSWSQTDSAPPVTNDQ